MPTRGYYYSLNNGCIRLRGSELLRCHVPSGSTWMPSLLRRFFASEGEQKEHNCGDSRSMLPCVVFHICWMSNLYASLIDSLVAGSGDKGDVSQSVREQATAVVDL